MKAEERSYKDLSEQECAEVYPVLIENYERHNRIAILLASHREYSNAISHLILGSEELLKAFVIALDSHGNRFRKLKGADKIFNWHKSKHRASLSISGYFYLIEGFCEFCIQISGTKTKKKQRRGKPHEINYAQWWLDANELKQKGFYVDFRERIISPSLLQKKDYLISKVFVNRFSKLVLDMIQTMSKNSREENDEMIKSNTILKKLIENVLKESIAPKAEV